MEIVTLALAIIAAVSELLPLFGDSSKYNGILHGIKSFFLHIHAESECHVDLNARGGTEIVPQTEPEK
jgi:hypothetical protein